MTVKSKLLQVCTYSCLSKVPTVSRANSPRNVYAADMYITAASSLAGVAANHAPQSVNKDLAMTPEQWQNCPELQHRFGLYRARALAAIQYAQLAAADISDPKEHSDTVAFLEEQVGMLQLEQVQDAPPLYDQMRHRPDKDSSSYQQACTAGLGAFERAQAILPEEWSFQLCIAKMLRKLQQDPRRVLHHLAQACMLAKQTVGGTVESMYQLHATRLKLLQEEQPDLDLLELYSFLPSASSGDQQPQSGESSTDSLLLSASAGRQQVSQADRTEAVYQDAMSAMRFCLEQSKQASRSGGHETFHKARYRRAQALRWRGHSKEALEELQPCFKGKSKHGLVINMFLIYEGVTKAAQVHTVRL